MTDSPPPNDQFNPAYRQLTKSSRRLSWGRRTFYRLALPVALGLVKSFWASYRIVRVHGGDYLDDALDRHKVVIPCLWHQHLMVLVPYLLGKRTLGMKLGFMISPSVDGEVGAMAAQRLGGHVVRGSSSYTGARALRDFYLAVAKENVSLLITPDGPRGPRYEAKSGALMIAQLAGKPVVPISYAANRVFKFRAWDRFILPLPFARVVIAVGEPIIVPKVMTPKDLEGMQKRLSDTLRELFESARKLL